ncbi:MAG: zinc ribbon domain-containing protein [Gemmatimonadales bacterium]
MPYYEYRCPSNGRTVEVRHAMAEHLTTWGDVARVAGLELSGTPADAPVERILSVPVPASASGESAAAAPVGCGAGCACAAARA